ncbi:hypothetical protein HDF16_004631 [Granulicella aggregans]|uniref:Uncharacterized protein n=1 Tax=Granulicella aggregans TaxID=474949 RepID=A0A7W7ZHB8_9BACT|nr:hypothetical protein [Granulicella aggregans]MBB5059902.1 hypothetical protein [Granulicella aggregans]
MPVNVERPIATEELTAPHGTFRLAENIARRYLRTLLLIPILGIALPYAFEAIPGLQNFAASRTAIMLDYSYTASHEDADVVIFGDSSALYGVDTKLLSSTLGMKVINLPGTKGSLAVTGDLPLRSYLAHNKPPKLIVFYLAPWNLDILNSHTNFWYDGAEEIIRHGSFRDVLKLWRKEPESIFTFPMTFYMQNNKLFSSIARRPFQLRPMVQGHTPFPLGVSLTSDCVLPNSFKIRPDATSVRNLLDKYRSSTTKTMLYFAPIPRCAGVGDILSESYGRLPVAASKVLPAEDFAKDPFFVHPMPKGTPTSTGIFEDAIRDFFAASPSY